MIPTDRVALDQNGTGQVVAPKTRSAAGVAPEAKGGRNPTPKAPGDVGVDAGNGLIERVRAKRVKVERTCGPSARGAAGWST